MDYHSIYEKNKENELSGRYITLKNIEPILGKHFAKNEIQVIGNSVLEKSIYSYRVGTGNFKILLWSQMHGNESTTTKALFDVFNFLDSDVEEVKKWKEKFSFYFIPMLNPDGAELYTRENANEVDLNRDFINLSQPESRLLMSVFNEFKPDFCFNLHDQRTIFGVAKTGKPATLSFLSPSYNEEREINDNRLQAINLISCINEELQKHIPGQIGRFDDSFNRNCVGDTFQQMGVPTVLFEAGHFSNDYQREETRKFIFIALLRSFQALYENDIVNNKIEDYLKIPQNNPCFFDIVYRNVKINYDNSIFITNFAVQFKEEIIENLLVFNAYISSVGDLEDFLGHLEYDVQGDLYEDEKGNFPKISEKANFTIGKHIKFVNGLLKN
ncbi:M14 family metallopeptidase [Flavobacterium azooxidireducens]|uniref:M14 family metallopeptidase n=1 Tax=Flavobacterium azooxidireducens TaxID=1871076 RepID=A0ABY4KFA0_9FLAO|nr:M14 metallopeptidase family protein [Flavobacterium azooxidireducens]UPQ79487.1 M14 family metallopeptidase [Flavobacterium azooxidireducens]